MSDLSIEPILQKLNKEIFYAVLDVTLDVEGELAVSVARSVFIESTRTVIRYPVLYPGNSVGAMYRYVELRDKGLMFLQKYNFIAGFEYHQTGIAGFEGRFEVQIADPRLIDKVLIALRTEENRRNPGLKMTYDIQSATARVVQLADSFHRFVLTLRERREDRSPLNVNDEYDVQYLFGALLVTRFDDVRPEEWTGSYAGASSRMDFLLKDESVVVETKMTRNGLTNKKLGDELIIDISRYKEVPDCRALVCFVYDPTHRLTNPVGIENDLSRVSNGLDVRVLIRPTT